jgi:hypothetical protein
LRHRDECGHSVRGLRGNGIEGQCQDVGAAHRQSHHRCRYEAETVGTAHGTRSRARNRLGVTPAAASMNLTALLRTLVAHEPLATPGSEQMNRPTKPDDVRVVAIDPSSERRHVIRRLLEHCFEPGEMAEADSRPSAIELVDRCPPEVVVLELRAALVVPLVSVA